MGNWWVVAAVAALAVIACFAYRRYRRRVALRAALGEDATYATLQGSGETQLAFDAEDRVFKFIEGEKVKTYTYPQILEVEKFDLVAQGSGLQKFWITVYVDDPVTPSWTFRFGDVRTRQLWVGHFKAAIRSHQNGTPDLVAPPDWNADARE